ncbi:nucleoside triphosphate pyrophosphohydrolase [Thermosynechococcus sp. HY591]|uniref:nucleoside triphosphate pyrophosphohydrolase n=2 Tax=Thermosynechococcus TaxID=146785 RepID=UPI002877E432|nr:MULTISPECIES: nucleoside triphosphate pyrophosphohydrolase [unclassified Thermosynechococcus]WNC64148.1 nucleoside triphosphate pyrophosphohydrolase [Thermosynechococcus sp. HY591]
MQRPVIAPMAMSLTVLSAATVLAEATELPEGGLITEIPTLAIAHRLAHHLRHHWPLETPLTLIDAQHQSTLLTLGELAELTEATCPLQLYVPPPLPEALIQFQRLIDVVRELRHPERGCPWDLQQTPTTLIPYVLEEAYEVVHALQEGDSRAIAEELGDLLLQVVLQSQLAQEANQFTLAQVIQGITDKLIRRHPHVFGEVALTTAQEVRDQWEQIKAAEKGAEDRLPLSQKLQRYARTLPPLMAGMKIGERASRAGLDWPTISGAWEKFYEELAEFQEALLQGNAEHQIAELGDLLFSVINLARWCQLDPVHALQQAYQRFIQRLERIEAAIDRPLETYTLEELEALWQQAKVQLAADNRTEVPPETKPEEA